MPAIQNTWIEKQKKKKVADIAPSYESNYFDSWLPVSPSKIVKRFYPAFTASFVRTLRGVRK
jgi:hypothetical protein